MLGMVSGVVVAGVLFPLMRIFSNNDDRNFVGSVGRLIDNGTMLHPDICLM
jgi:hypothetical protein